MQEEKKRMQVNQDMADKTQNQEKVQMTIITQKKNTETNKSNKSSQAGWWKQRFWNTYSTRFKP